MVSCLGYVGELRTWSVIPNHDSLCCLVVHSIRQTPRPVGNVQVRQCRLAEVCERHNLRTEPELTERRMEIRSYVCSTGGST